MSASFNQVPVLFKALTCHDQFLGRFSSAWRKIGLQWRLHLWIQISLGIFFVSSQYWVVEKFDAQGKSEIENQARETANGLINGLNLLMITGQISDPVNRNLLLQKMSSSQGIKKLHLVRAAQVSAQFGPGLPSEYPADELASRVTATGEPSFTQVTSADGTHLLRVIIPFIASENFRGTNCLACHQVKPGSVNGAADIHMDLSAHEQRMSLFKQQLWSVMLFFQVALSLLLALFVNRLMKFNISQPVNQLKATMEEINQSGDLSLRVNIEGDYPDIDRIASSFNSLIGKLEFVTEEMSLLAKVVANSEEAILITDADMRIVFVNGAFVRITGYLEKEVIGETPNILKSGRQDSHFYHHMWDQIKTKGSWKGEIFNRRKNGEIFPEWQSISVVRNSKGSVTNYVSIFLDITKRKEAEERISRMANYDALTGLANRNLLNDRLSHDLSCAHRQNTRLAVMYLDLDNFKDINDGYGHAAGDILLKSAAERLLDCVREGDTVARQGGDEFILVFPDVDGSDGVAKIAEKLLKSVSAPYFIGGQEMFVSVSIGIGIFPDDGKNMETLLENSDHAMYNAKQEGRSCYRFFTQELNVIASRRVYLLNRLRHALSNNELELHYQPQLDVEKNVIAGVEALIRWRDPNEGFISPAEFIPLAEDSGLIVSIGRWILLTACKDARHWHEQGHNVTIAVNVSARQFKERNFDMSVEEALKNSGLEPQYLELELTEGVLRQQDGLLNTTLSKLKAIGVKLALDDFGTEYSSLSYIKKFSIDRIKIDQLFVRDVSEDPSGAAIIDGMIHIAHGLNLKVIAEGVETIEQLNFLSSHHCTDVQGCFVSPPVPREQMVAVFNAFQEREPCLEPNR